MSNIDTNNTTNPMKKRFRSWQPSPDEQPRRQRRYPRLVVRDRTGNHIANAISTAPKVELPKQPIIPRSITVPANSVPKPNDKTEKIVPKQDTASRVAPVNLVSPVDSASTEYRRIQQVEKRFVRPSPISPLLAKSSAVNNNEGIMFPSSSHNAAYPASNEADVHPQQPLTNPVPVVRVNQVPLHVQTEYPSLQSNPGPRTMPAICAPYDVSSCTPTPSVEPMATTFAPRGVTYAAQVVGHSAPRQSDECTSPAVHSSPQRSTVYQSQAPDRQLPIEPASVTAPAPRPAQAPVDSYPSDNNEFLERVILAGKRCGTVEYWRSSLQMPREKGVVKSVKAPAVQVKKKGKQESPERTFVGEPAHPTQPPRHTASPPKCLQPSVYASEYTSQRPVPAADVSVQNCGNQTLKPLDQNSRHPETELGHEFWRTATKLPRASAEAMRVKKLANGRRRIDASNIDCFDNPHQTGVARSMSEALTTGSPVSGRQYGSAPQAGATNVGMQTKYVPQPSSSALDAQYSGAAIPTAQNLDVNRQQIALRPGPLPTERTSRAKAESETRRLLFLRDFELRRLRTLAQSKFHVKMNLRGRMKLEQWVCSDAVTIAASELIVTMFNLDRRVLSHDDAIRRNSLYDMTNEDLRILEALMCRVRSRGGRTNWALLTTSLSVESFITTLPATEVL